MGIFNFLHKKPKDFFTDAEEQEIVAAIKQAEIRTSGEVRVYIESKCNYVNALDRASEVFLSLEMFNTKERNATLIYVALKDHQAAILGDTGIAAKVGADFWNDEIAAMLGHFKNNNIKDGMVAIINDIGDVLHTHFPYDNVNDVNELPDDIVFGK
ncbi:TPM domain-containing protein [Polluticaenibacter yanchengensis]|uniref:TPM domain-containing protein n=1 Tax=Polluticaenibacter yanchengensis TaxID=3014562 RepID=A0ABT4UIC8_9BACT|nr:TPM domain-containing protein [Chitinophagaceae bacterium LY-5]